MGFLLPLRTPNPDRNTDEGEGEGEGEDGVELIQWKADNNPLIAVIRTYIKYTQFNF